MALSKNYEYKIEYTTGVSKENAEQITGIYEPKIYKTYMITNAYVQVKNIDGDKNCINFSVYTYLDKSKMCVIGIQEFTFKPLSADESPNFIKQAYEYLKTLPEYADAIDVLEEGQC